MCWGVLNNNPYILQFTIVSDTEITFLSNGEKRTIDIVGQHIKKMLQNIIQYILMWGKKSMIAKSKSYMYRPVKSSQLNPIAKCEFMV